MRQVEIMVKGQVDKDWSNWFGGMQIKHTAHGGTILRGPVRDQAELRGILSRLADLGLELISVMTLRGGGEYKRKNSSPRPKQDQA
jgi:hypothetical protein